MNKVSQLIDSLSQNNYPTPLLPSHIHSSHFPSLRIISENFDFAMAYSLLERALEEGQRSLFNFLEKTRTLGGRDEEKEILEKECKRILQQNGVRRQTLRELITKDPRLRFAIQSIFNGQKLALVFQFTHNIVQQDLKPNLDAQFFFISLQGRWARLYPRHVRASSRKFFIVEEQRPVTVSQELINEKRKRSGRSTMKFLPVQNVALVRQNQSQTDVKGLKGKQVIMQTDKKNLQLCGQIRILIEGKKLKDRHTQTKQKQKQRPLHQSTAVKSIEEQYTQTFALPFELHSTDLLTHQVSLRNSMEWLLQQDLFAEKRRQQSWLSQIQLQFERVSRGVGSQLDMLEKECQSCVQVSDKQCQDQLKNSTACTSTDYSSSDQESQACLSYSLFSTQIYVQSKEQAQQVAVPSSEVGVQTALQLIPKGVQAQVQTLDKQCQPFLTNSNFQSQTERPDFTQHEIQIISLETSYQQSSCLTERPDLTQHEIQIITLVTSYQQSSCLACVELQDCLQQTQLYTQDRDVQSTFATAQTGTGEQLQLQEVDSQTEVQRIQVESQSEVQLDSREVQTSVEFKDQNIGQVLILQDKATQQQPLLLNSGMQTNVRLFKSEAVMAVKSCDTSSTQTLIQVAHKETFHQAQTAEQQIQVCPLRVHFRLQTNIQIASNETGMQTANVSVHRLVNTQIRQYKNQGCNPNFPVQQDRLIQTRIQMQDWSCQTKGISAQVLQTKFPSRGERSRVNTEYRAEPRYSPNYFMEEPFQAKRREEAMGPMQRQMLREVKVQGRPSHVGSPRRDNYEERVRKAYNPLYYDRR